MTLDHGGASYEAIGRVLGISRTAVVSAERRGLEKLKAVFDELGVGFSDLVPDERDPNHWEQIFQEAPGEYGTRARELSEEAKAKHAAYMRARYHRQKEQP